MVPFLPGGAVGGELSLRAGLPAAVQRCSGVSRQYHTKVGLSGNVSMGTVSSPIESTITMTALEQINAVANGKSSVTYSLKNGTVSVKLPNLMGDDNTPQSIDQPMPDFAMDFDRTPLGKISNLKMSGEAGNLLGGAPNQVNNQLINPEEGLEFPDKDLQPGDTWTRTTTVSINADSKARHHRQLYAGGHESRGERQNLSASGS